MAKRKVMKKYVIQARTGKFKTMGTTKYKTVKAAQRAISRAPLSPIIRVKPVK